MSENLYMRQPEDYKKVNIRHPWELDYWVEELEVSEQRLKDAVEAAGIMASDVRAWLARN